jgi:CheY-like chemotaxis protein
MGRVLRSSRFRLVRSALGAGEHIAADRRQALDVLPEQRFDLVLCDLRLPGMGWREFCQELQVVAAILVGRLPSSVATPPALRHAI